MPDNLKSGVHKPCFFEPRINHTYADLAGHYGTVVIPARPRKPVTKQKRRWESKLFADLTLACGDGRYPRLFRSLCRTQLLILDDWGPEPLPRPSSATCSKFSKTATAAPTHPSLHRRHQDDEDDRQKIGAMSLKQPEQPHHKSGTFSVGTFGTFSIGIYNAHKITLKGESMRKRDAKHLDDKPAD